MILVDGRRMKKGNGGTKNQVETNIIRHLTMHPFAVLCDSESNSGWEKEPSTALEFELDTLQRIIDSHTRRERLGGKLE